MESEQDLRERSRVLIKAAKETAESKRRNALIAEALNLAQQAEAMARQDRSRQCKPTPPRREPRRQSFTLYLLSGGHFADARHFDIGSDDQALAVAYAVHDACSDAFEDFELWHESRLVAGNAQKRGPRLPAGAAEVTDATQERVLQTEESLLLSRRALTESRRLLAATEDLRKKLGREREAPGTGT
jgi:hypothetical protein